MKRAILVCSLLSVPAFHAAHAADAPRTIVLVRHGERVLPDGDTSLNEKGRERARALADTLRQVNVQNVFVSQMIRTRETAEPIASQKGLKPEAVPTTELDRLVQKLSATPPGTVTLVVHHGGTIPQIVEKLGGGKIDPIPEEAFDRMVVLTLSAGSQPSVLTLRYGPK